VHLIKIRTKSTSDHPESILSANGASTKVKELKILARYELEKNDFEYYKSKQIQLNELGVTALLAKIVSAFGDFTPGSLSDVALELLVEMLNGGSDAVAKTLYDHLVELEIEGKFFHHMAARLESSIKGIKEYKARGYFGGTAHGVPTDKFISLCGECIQSSRLLQLFCENHYGDFQNLLRDQPMYRSKYNLIEKIIEMLTLTCESPQLVENFEEIELALVTQLLSTLTESMMGPCSGNQELIVHSDAISAVNFIMTAVNKVDVESASKNSNHRSIHSSACVMLASCLEGRHDFILHRQLRRKLEFNHLSSYMETVKKEIVKIHKYAKSKDRVVNGEEINRIDNAQDALVAILSVVTELNIESKLDALDGFDDNVDAKDEDYLKIPDESYFVGSVEVVWNGKTEHVVFPLPLEIKHIPISTKTNFKDAVDLTTTEKR